MIDKEKCKDCIHLQAPEIRTTCHAFKDKVWEDIDIINRCELSGYPVGCVSADQYCRRETA